MEIGESTSTQEIDTIGHPKELSKDKPLETTGLSKLKAVIKNPSVAKQQFDFLITNNRHLPEHLGDISLEEFVNVMKRMRIGLTEATKCRNQGEIMGEGAIPSDIAWVSGIIQGEKTSKIGYQKDGDRILVTATAIAELAHSARKGLGYKYDKLDNAIVRSEDLALLLIAEEATHRYDVQVKGLEFGDTTSNRDYSLEKNAEQVIRQIVDRLNIPTF